MQDEITVIKKDNLDIHIYQDKDELGKASAKFVTEKLRDAIYENGKASLILATGASQFEFLEYLQKQKIEWNRITVFHLDEYKGINENHPASFRKYLKDRILKKVQPKQVYYLNGDEPDIESETRHYEKLLREHPVDIACIGIGENGHIAFNDPPVADFNDPRLVKVVELDDACRNQQLGEGWFPTFDDVPTHALTLTIPAIMNSKIISCVVSEERKAQAVFNALNNEISTACPASILRKHPAAVLHLDTAAALKIM